MTNPSTRWVRTCCPSGHGLGSQGPLCDWPKLSDSSSDWPRGSASVSARGRDSSTAVSAFAGSCCGRLRSVGRAVSGGRRGGGFSPEGVMKGEEGGDCEDRLDSAVSSRERRS